eukprot:m.1645478 g.1645478  ORF g.1645478 m.1645478 type:complete len:70 (-) comp67673_c0_seq1:1167-1376(-)
MRSRVEVSHRAKKTNHIESQHQRAHHTVYILTPKIKSDVSGHAVGTTRVCVWILLYTIIIIRGADYDGK